jgi:hypothetical protein
MKTVSITLKALTLTFFMLTLSTFANAQATRTWVSGVGDDLNPCSRTAPCKTFAGAVSKTAIAGEINAIDPGGYGTVTLTKSMTIDGGGTMASILASGTNGVIVNIAANANDPQRRVTLRRLSINGTGAVNGVGQNTGLNGIRYLAGNQLNVENCYIQNFTTAGIDANLTQTGSVLFVKDTYINNVPTGIQMTSTTGAVGGLIDNVRIEKGTNGILAKDRTFLNVRNSTITIMSTVGMAIQGASNQGGLNVENCFISSTNTGIAVGNAGTKLDLSNTSIFNNTTGVSSGGGTYNSHTNNRFGFNTSDGVAPSNQLGQK